MTRLVVVELRRLLARRLTRWAAVGVLVILAFTSYSAHEQVYELTPARIAQVRAEQLQPCLESQAQARQQDPNADFHCTDAAFGNPDGQSAAFASVAAGSLGSTSYLLLFLAFLVGVSFVAAEFSSGAIGTWLTYEPRRTRVYVSKVVAATSSALVVAVVSVGVLCGVVYLFARSYDIVGATSGPPADHLVEVALRTVAVVGMAGLLGAVLGTLLRHTAAALGVAIGYLVLIEGIVLDVLRTAVPEPRPWLIYPNVIAWLQGGLQDDRAFDQPGVCTPEGVCNPPELISTTHAGFYLLVLSVLAFVVGAVVFRRRDVN